MDKNEKGLKDAINYHLSIHSILKYFRECDKMELSTLVASSMRVICESDCDDDAIEAISNFWIVLGARAQKKVATMASVDPLLVSQKEAVADMIECGRYARENGDIVRAARAALKKAGWQLINGGKRDVENSGVLASEACLALLLSARMMGMANAN